MNHILKYLKTTLEILLVLLFIFFEEIIWKTIALPIAKYILSFKLLDGLKAKIMKQTPYRTLTIFLIPLAIAEWMGIRSGVLFISGSIISAISLYIAKIPVAAITFWIFSFSKEKLLTIDWFATLYGLLIRFLNFIKNTDIYISVKAKLFEYKAYIKSKFNEFKIYIRSYFPEKGGFKEHIQEVYINIKKTFQDKKSNKSKKKKKKYKDSSKSKVKEDTMNKNKGNENG